MKRPSCLPVTSAPTVAPDAPQTGILHAFAAALVLRILLAVERQTWCGTAPTCRETITHLCGALGDTTYSRDETDTGC